MKQLEGEQTLMRIIFGESDHCGGRPLLDVLLELLRQEGFAGATALKGVAGFGAHSVLHTDKLLRFSADLPVVVEVVDNNDKVEAILPRLEPMLQGGIVTLERARVIHYQPGDKARR